jgi:hypothetical protein
MHLRQSLTKIGQLFPLLILGADMYTANRDPEKKYACFSCVPHGEARLGIPLRAWITLPELWVVCLVTVAGTVIFPYP